MGGWQCFLLYMPLKPNALKLSCIALRANDRWPPAPLALFFIVANDEKQNLPNEEWAVLRCRNQQLDEPRLLAFEDFCSVQLRLKRVCDGKISVDCGGPSGLSTVRPFGPHKLMARVVHATLAPHTTINLECSALFLSPVVTSPCAYARPGNSHSSWSADALCLQAAQRTVSQPVAASAIHKCRA